MPEYALTDNSSMAGPPAISDCNAVTPGAGEGVVSGTADASVFFGDMCWPTGFSLTMMLARRKKYEIPCSRESMDRYGRSRSLASRI